MNRALLSLTAGAVAFGSLAGAARAQEPAPQAPVTGKVVERGNWDGKPQPRRGGLPATWLGLQVKPGAKICFELRCARYSLRLVKTPLRDGTRAARFEVRDGDNPFGDAERAEVQGSAIGTAGSLRWYTWSTYFPADSPLGQANENRWLSFMQWAVNRGSAPIAMTVNRGNIVLQINDQASSRRFVGVRRPWATPVAPLLGRWIDFAMFVRWSPKAATGQVQLWVDGVQQQMNWPFGETDPARFGGLGATTFTGRTMVPGGGATFVRQGIVRAKKFRGRTVILHDALTSYATSTTPPPPAPPAPDPAAPPA